MSADPVAPGKCCNIAANSYVNTGPTAVAVSTITVTFPLFAFAGTMAVIDDSLTL